MKIMIFCASAQKSTGRPVVMQSNALNWQEAELIYDILVEECGAPDRGANFGERWQFVYYHTREQQYFPTEWRFIGSLGFGGKFWHEHNGWRVSCYREDETPERLACIKKANARLEALRMRMTMEEPA